MSETVNLSETFLVMLNHIMTDFYEQDLRKLIAVNGLSLEDLEAEYPRFFDKPGATKGYVLMRLLVHLGYHLGQVNYLRRVLG